MMRKNRYYPPEFKREALVMLATGEYTMAELDPSWTIEDGCQTMIVDYDTRSPACPIPA